MRKDAVRRFGHFVSRLVSGVTPVCLPSAHIIHLFQSSSLGFLLLKRTRYPGKSGRDADETLLIGPLAMVLRAELSCDECRNWPVACMRVSPMQDILCGMHT